MSRGVSPIFFVLFLLGGNSLDGLFGQGLIIPGAGSIHRAMGGGLGSGSRGRGGGLLLESGRHQRSGEQRVLLQC